MSGYFNAFHLKVMDLNLANVLCMHKPKYNYETKTRQNFSNYILKGDFYEYFFSKGVLQFGIQINMSYLTDSYIVFTLKLESGSKIIICGLKVMVKSGLKKLF